MKSMKTEKNKGLRVQYRGKSDLKKANRKVIQRSS